jgi:DnaK suppressor protein
VTDTSAVRSALEDERERLAAQLAGITAVPRDPMGAVSFGKRVGEGTSQAIERIEQVDVAKRLEAKLADVVRALEKLADGSYGRCDVCGEPIAPERLDAMPWAVRCVRDAAVR